MKVLLFGKYDGNEITEAPIKVGRELLNNLVSKGIKADYICYYQDGKKYTIHQKLFGRIKEANNVYRLGVLQQLIKIIFDKPDVIHFNTPAAFYIPILFLCKAFKIPTIYTVHWLIRYHYTNYRNVKGYQMYRIFCIEKLLFTYCSKLLFLSEKEKLLASKLYNINENKTAGIDNGIKLYQLNKLATEKNEKIKILFVGGIERREKGFSLIQEIAKYYDDKIVINVANYYEQVAIDNISNINYYKPLNEYELREKMVENDLIIVPSKYDPFNIVLLEAISCGLPFIVSDRVGFVERFPVEFKEWVVRYNNVKDYISKIDKIIKMNDNDLIVLQKKEIAFAQKYTWDKIADKYIKYYEEQVTKNE